VLAARTLLALLDGERPGDVLAELPVFVARGSTAAPARVPDAA
jgi:hypothetical protein